MASIKVLGLDIKWFTMVLGLDELSDMDVMLIESGICAGNTHGEILEGDDEAIVWEIEMSELERAAYEKWYYADGNTGGFHIYKQSLIKAK